MWLFLFLLLIPTQLGKHFWPDWSYVLGIRIDYLSPTLYLLDLVWIGLVIFNFKFEIFNQFKKLLNFKTLLILGFVGINILMAVNPWVAVYKWLRVGQLLITFFYFKKNKALIKEKLVKVIPGWIILESLLAVAQMAKNGSLNGWFYWLGERSFTFNTIGVAQISVLGRGLIRAYGTFSHPNSLAGFLLVSLLLWWWLKPTQNPPALRAPSLEKGGLIINIFWWGVFWLGLLGIFVSGSRTIWILTLILILGFVLKNIKNKIKVATLILLFLGMIFFGFKLVNMEYQVSDFLGGWDADGIGKRTQLNWAGVKMFKESPLFGVGLGNFLVRLPEFQKNNGIFWLQPVHNIFLLIISEVGLLGLILLIFNLKFLIFKNKRINIFFILIFGVILVSGMVDHYWLTLPQNVWLLVLVLGIV